MLNQNPTQLYQLLFGGVGCVGPRGVADDGRNAGHACDRRAGVYGVDIGDAAAGVFSLFFPDASLGTEKCRSGGSTPDVISMQGDHHCFFEEIAPGSYEGDGIGLKREEEIVEGQAEAGMSKLRKRGCR